MFALTKVKNYINVLETCNLMKNPQIYPNPAMGRTASIYTFSAKITGRTNFYNQAKLFNRKKIFQSNKGATRLYLTNSYQ